MKQRLSVHVSLPDSMALIEKATRPGMPLLLLPPAPALPLPTRMTVAGKEVTRLDELVNALNENTKSRSAVLPTVKTNSVPLENPNFGVASQINNSVSQEPGSRASGVPPRHGEFNPWS